VGKKKKKKIHKFRKIKKFKEILRLCPNIKRFDQDVLELFHRRLTIFKTSYILLSPYVPAKLTDFLIGLTSNLRHNSNRIP